MKKIILCITLTFWAIVSMSGQDIQLHYDLGHNLYRGGERDLGARAPITTTVEMFKADKWGSTFFFVDFNYGQLKKENKVVSAGVLGAYWEISHELKFWDAPFSAHIEYDGGLNHSIVYDNAWLVGPTWSYANSDFSTVLSLTAMYKYIPRNIKPNNFQITAVWNIWMLRRQFLFCGFADFWREKRLWQKTDFIFLSQPQIWYNLNTIKGLDDFNMSVGSELEISNNFVAKGFYVIPTIAVKWTF